MQSANVNHLLNYPILSTCHIKSIIPTANTKQAYEKEEISVMGTVLFGLLYSYNVMSVDVGPTKDLCHAHCTFYSVGLS